MDDGSPRCYQSFHAKWCPTCGQTAEERDAELHVRNSRLREALIALVEAIVNRGRGPNGERILTVAAKNARLSIRNNR